MRVEVRCSNCQARLRLPAGLSGTVRCPKCARIFFADTHTRSRNSRPDDGWRERLLASVAGMGTASTSKSSDRTGTVLLLSAISAFQMFILGGVVALATLLFLNANSEVSNVLLALLFGCLLICVPSGLMYIRAHRIYRRTEILNATQAILRARTRPILYLRSFNIDEEMARHRSIIELMFSGLFFYKIPTLEERLVQVLSIIGPVIAIGRPREKLPALGAARFYVAEDHWKGKVAEIAKESEFVVWVSGMTEGLQWELRHLINAVPPEKLIVWAHPHILRLKCRERERAWRAFVDGLGANFLVPLPRRLGDTRAFFSGPSLNHMLCARMNMPYGAPKKTPCELFFLTREFCVYRLATGAL